MFKFEKNFFADRQLYRRARHARTGKQSAESLFSGRSIWQSARLPHLSWKIEIGRGWYRSQIGRGLWAKEKMCTPVHGLSGFSAIKQTDSPCTGVHILTFTSQTRPFWLLYQSRPICLNKVFAPTVWRAGFRALPETDSLGFRVYKSGGVNPDVSHKWKTCSMTVRVLSPLKPLLI